MKISVVSPVYGAEKIIPELVRRIKSVLEKITQEYEIVLIEDGSPDKSWEAIELACKKHTEVIGIKLSRNFGQHYAITAGIEKSTGDVIVLMDCDLQDDPKSIASLIEQYKKGFDIVFTKRAMRKHSLFKKVSAALFNSLFRYVGNKEFDVDAGTLVLFSKSVRTAFLSINDADRLYLQLLKWVGFNKTFVTVPHNDRFEGESSYSFSRLLNVALQGYTSFSNKLLHITIILGTLIALASFFAILVIVVMYFYNGFQSGWASLITAIFFSTGLILLNMGVVGLYVGKIFNQTKNRPLYIIERSLSL
tara:strand:- start:153504 stop:154421 length:918 start_codon:yes stop_codon:yes gene_type:complete